MAKVLALVVGLWGLSAAASVERVGYLIKTDFSYEAGGQKIKTSSEVVVAAANTSWNQLNVTREGVILLGRLIETNPATVQMEYLLLDTRRQNMVVSSPGIIARLGQKATMESRDEKEKVSVSLTATKKKIP